MLSVIPYHSVRFKLNVVHHKKELDSQALRESCCFIRTFLFCIGASELGICRGRVTSEVSFTSYAAISNEL